MSTKLLEGSVFVMESSGSQISDGGFFNCSEVNFLQADVAEFPFAIFMFDCAAGGFSVAPTAGAVINIYEQPFNADANQAPLPDATHKHGYIGSFPVDVADVQQRLITRPLLINLYGADYSLEWLDGGAGTASIDTGWTLDVQLVTHEDV